MAKTKKEGDTLSCYEVEELAQFLVGRGDDDLETSEIEQLFYDKYDITLDRFEELLKDLWPLLSIGISPITDKAFAGFSDKKNGLWIVNKNIEGDFVNCIIQWMGGDALKKKDDGYRRDITTGGDIEFEITLIKK